VLLVGGICASVGHTILASAESGWHGVVVAFVAGCWPSSVAIHEKVRRSAVIILLGPSGYGGLR